MKVLLTDIFNNWYHWTYEKELFKYDLFIYLEGQKYEVSGVNRDKETLSYVNKQNRIITIPASRIPYLIAKKYDEADSRK